MAKKPNPDPPGYHRASCVIDPELEAEVRDVTERFSTNRSALFRRGIRLALDELKQGLQATTTKARKG